MHTLNLSRPIYYSKALEIQLLHYEFGLVKALEIPLLHNKAPGAYARELLGSETLLIES